jgi:hypothetical protein
MSDAPETTAGGRPSPRLVLCRHCAEYVFEGTAVCPHCGHDAREIGARYRDGGYLAIEAIQRIEDALARLRAKSESGFSSPGEKSP